MNVKYCQNGVFDPLLKLELCISKKTNLANYDIFMSLRVILQEDHTLYHAHVFPSYAS